MLVEKKCIKCKNKIFYKNLCRKCYQEYLNEKNNLTRVCKYDGKSEVVKKILLMYSEERKSKKEISNVLGCSYRYVCQVVKKYIMEI